MDKYEYGNVTINDLEEDESDCKSKVGVRGKLDLMSNVFTIIRIILLMEPARDIHVIFISKHVFSLFHYFIILVISLFPYLDYYY